MLCTIMELLNYFYSEGEQLVRILETATPSRESKVTKEDIMRRVIDDVKQMGEWWSWWCYGYDAQISVVIGHDYMCCLILK